MSVREGSFENIETVIIGAGQAGLATGYFLNRSNKPFVILEKAGRIGDSWRNRWDSLHLFTPAKYDNLPGMRFPGRTAGFPSRDEMADYLEEYAGKFSIPVLLGTTVYKLHAIEKSFKIETNRGVINSENIVIATGTNPVPKVPSFAAELNPRIHQLHSSGYKNANGIPDGDVLVVGAGTSGVEIAVELAANHKTYIAGTPTFHIPDPVFRYAGGLYWWIISNMLTVSTPMGRKAREQVLRGGSPLIRISEKDLRSAGVTRLERVTGVRNGFPLFPDGKILEVSSVIWATGYKPDFSWINEGISDQSGWPAGRRGISDRIKGLYFIGMPFQYGLTSGLVGGVGRDAEYISRFI